MMHECDRILCAHNRVYSECVNYVFPPTRWWICSCCLFQSLEDEENIDSKLINGKKFNELILKKWEMKGEFE